MPREFQKHSIYWFYIILIITFLLEFKKFQQIINEYTYMYVDEDIFQFIIIFMKTDKNDINVIS